MGWTWMGYLGSLWVGPKDLILCCMALWLLFLTCLFSVSCNITYSMLLNVSLYIRQSHYWFITVNCYLLLYPKGKVFYNCEYLVVIPHIIVLWTIRWFHLAAQLVMKNMTSFYELGSKCNHVCWKHFLSWSTSQLIQWCYHLVFWNYPT